MDPNAALANARKALAEFRAAEAATRTQGPLTTIRGVGQMIDMAEAASDLADAFEALDGWMSKQGYAPAEWGAR